MFEQISTSTIVLFSIIALLCITCILILILLSKINHKINYLEDLISGTLYQQHISEKTTKKLINSIELTSVKVDFLSSSTEKVLSEVQENKERKIYPRPKLVEEIEKTIQDQVSIEMIKSVNLKAPRNDYIEIITNNVLKTYPEVDPDYICNKCIAIIQAQTMGEL